MSIEKEKGEIYVFIKRERMRLRRESERERVLSHTHFGRTCRQNLKITLKFIFHPRGKKKGL